MRLSTPPSATAVKRSRPSPNSAKRYRPCPFFGGGKVPFGSKTAISSPTTAPVPPAAVTETLSDIAQELKEFAWQSVRLLISAAKVDKRKVFFKTLDKLGTVESFAGWSIDDKNWADQAEMWARKAIRSKEKEISEEALGEIITRVGPNPRQLDTEIEKLSLYVGDRKDITLEDVEAICSRNKMARAFALGDALGDRDLPRLLKRLDEELWEVKFDSQKSEIGLLYGLIAKVRAMLLKEMLREGWIKPDADYNRFKSQLDSVPADQTCPPIAASMASALNPALPFTKPRKCKN